MKRDSCYISLGRDGSTGIHEVLMTGTKRKLRISQVLLGLILAIIVFAGILFIVYCYLDSPVAANETSDVVFTVPKGASVSGVAEELELEGLVRSSLFINAYARFREAGLIAGSYRLSPSMKSSEIWEKLVDITQQSAQRLMIREGMTMRHPRLLEEQSICGKAVPNSLH